MSAKVVMNPNAKDAKCFGLITMSTESEADKAIARLNTHKLHERVITCERPRKDNAVLKKVRPPPASTDKKVTWCLSMGSEMCCMTLSNPIPQWPE